MLERLGIPTHILPEIVPPGTTLGDYEGIPVIAPATHDTGSAVAAVPAQTLNYAYISSGTWSLVGLEVPEAVINDEAYEANVTNEGGVEDTYRLLKNVMGLWVIQQCRRTWNSQGYDYSYDDLVRLAQEAEALRSVVDVDDNRFLAPGDHPLHVQDWCREHGEPVPESHGQIIRCVLESLALKYRDALENLQQIAGQEVEVIHIVGGGTQNTLLNQFTADATGMTVITGPIEATVLGNAAVQLIALGDLGSVADARQIVASMGVTQIYESQRSAQWDAAYGRLIRP